MAIMKFFSIELLRSSISAQPVYRPLNHAISYTYTIVCGRPHTSHRWYISHIPHLVHTSVNPLKSEFLIYLHGGIYRIIHHGDYGIYTSMEVYEKYTPQGVNQEVCPGHVTRLRSHDGSSFR